MFNYLDFIVIAAFFLVLLMIPAIAAMRSRGKGANEYFKSAGSMPWWLIGISMVAATTSTNSANLFTEIIRFRTKTEMLSSDINRIRPIIHSTLKSFKTARRAEKFNFFLIIHIFNPRIIYHT